MVPDPRGLEEVIDQLVPIRTPGGIASAGWPGCKVAVWLERAVFSIRGGVASRSTRTVRLRKGAMP